MRKFISLILLASVFAVTENVVAKTSTSHEFEIVKDVGTPTIEATQISVYTLEAVNVDASLVVVRQESFYVAEANTISPLLTEPDSVERICWRQPGNEFLRKPPLLTASSENSVRAWS